MGPEDTGFMLVHGSSSKFGKIIMCNQAFKKAVGLNSNDLRAVTIYDFMPILIKGWHNSFVADFTRNGATIGGVMNRTTCSFVKKKNRYVTPAMTTARFHYSRDYNFTFCFFASFMQDIQILKTPGTGRHKVDEVLFFLCEDIDGKVLDISESCNKQLGLSIETLHNNDLDTMFTDLSIEDICPSLSLARIKELRDNSENSMNSSGMMTAVIEEIVDIDLNVIKAMGRGGIPGRSGLKPKVQRALC